MNNMVYLMKEVVKMIHGQHRVAKEVAICKHCKNVLILTEKANQRAGLATELAFKCTNDKCKSHHNKGFFTSTKSRGVYDRNRESVVASRAIGKGCSGLENFCSILGLCSISRNTFTELTKFWEGHPSKLIDETLANSAERAKQLIIDNSLPSDTQIVDVPTCFDRSWSRRGWVARKGVVPAIAENTSQVIDIIFKSNYCNYCETLMEKRKSGKIDELEYLSLYTEHEVDCFHNHDRSPQVRLRALFS